jgi:glucose/arabinose dehydrogenase
MNKKSHLSKPRQIWLFALLTFHGMIGLAVLLLLVVQFPTFAQTPQDQPEIALTQVASGLERPVHITHAGDGSGRIFIVEQAGRIQILDDGGLLATPFLDIQDRVLSPGSGGGNEEGLLSVVFPPGYGTKGYFYVYYTMNSGDNVVARFSLSADTNQADPASEEEILLLPHPTYANHNGGQMAFGPDGMLYIGTGDGGGGGDPLDNAQDPDSLNGKLLRIDVEMALSGKISTAGAYFNYMPYFCNNSGRNTAVYRIPDDNPFVGEATYRPEIWALGLRNPWRFSFDRETGDLFIADVGQNRWEEVNFQPASSPGGENYGWNIMEGEECYQADSCDKSGLSLPVFVYPTLSPDCSVTGGFVYRGQAHPVLLGDYIFGDFCSGTIWGLRQVGDAWERQVLINSGYRISAFGEDENGEIYLADISGGGIYQITVP